MTISSAAIAASSPLLPWLPPARASASSNFSTASTPEGLRERVEQILARNNVRFDAQWELGAKPYLTDAGSLVDAVVAAVGAVAGIAPQLSTTGGTSDGRFLAEICPHVIELGPTNATIHKVNEYVPLVDLELLPQMYRAILERLLR